MEDMRLRVERRLGEFLSNYQDVDNDPRSPYSIVSEFRQLIPILEFADCKLLEFVLENIHSNKELLEELSIKIGSPEKLVTNQMIEDILTTCTGVAVSSES